MSERWQHVSRLYDQPSALLLGAEHGEEFYVLTVYEPRRRWFRLRSRWELWRSKPSDNGAIVVSAPMSSGWLPPCDYLQVSSNQPPEPS